MNAPLLALAALSVLGGVVVFQLPGFLHGVTEGLVPAADAAAHGTAAAGHAAAGAEAAAHGPTALRLTDFLTWQTAVSVLAAGAGMAAAFFGFGPERFGRGWSPAWERRLTAHQNLYEGGLHALFVRGGTAFAGLLYSVVDRMVIDWLVDAAGRFVDYLAESLRLAQSGYVRGYALYMLAGAVFVVGCFMLVLQKVPWR